MINTCRASEAHFSHSQSLKHFGVSVDVDIVDLQVQANASMPASKMPIYRAKNMRYVHFEVCEKCGMETNFHVSRAGP